MKTSWKTLAATAAVAFAIAACGNGGTASTTPAAGSSPATSAATTSLVTDSAAADLRTQLSLLLGEHLLIATKATDAAVHGNTAEFQAYGAALNSNGTDIGNMIGAAYGDSAKATFNQVWSAHNGFFVDYTVAAAKKDQAGMDAAVNNLKTKYITPFASFLAGATGLPNDTLVQLLTAHVTDTATIVNDEVAADYTKMYADVRTAYAQMFQIGNPLANAIAKKVSDKFPGDASGKAVDFRVALNQLLQEHLYLASLATDAALQGHSDEFKAAGDALNANGTDIGAAIGSLYGADAQAKFNGIWSAHNGFFVDYTTGVATKDAAKSAAAVNNLTMQYIPQFASFIASATGLPSDAVSGLTTTHVLTTKAIVDDQGMADWAKTATDDVAAGRHMQKIGDPLAKAIVNKVPAKFQA